jgi:UDP-N-acetylmuramoyl-tripeptide--D-alanyl-D-alanine ligase
VASLTIEFVRQATGAALSGPPPADPLTGVGTDSRTIAPGQLFVALAGPNFDGHDFVPQALADGAAAALVRTGYAAPPEMTGVCLLRVPDTLRALGDLAGAWRREQSALVAGLTGSNGKTSTKEMLAAILQKRHRVLKTQGNLNNLIGLPLTLLGLGPEHTACVVEMGMSALGEIARLTEIAAPELGLITNVGPAHLGPLGSLANIAQAKTELQQRLGTQRLHNMSGRHVCDFMPQHPGQLRLVFHVIENAPGNIDEAPRYGKGIDRGIVHNPEGPG